MNVAITRESLAHHPELTVSVRDKYRVSDTVVAVELVRLDGKPCPSWEAGAHVDFLLPNGFTRQYSLCGKPGEQSYWRFGVLREEHSRGGSAFIHETLGKGDVLKLRGPRNNFKFVDAKRYVFVAGGIGITPLIPMMHMANARGADWRLFYGGRKRASMAFADEVAALGDVYLRPEDEHGLLDLGNILNGLESGDAVYCCGPNPLINAMEMRFNRRNDCSLHFERFKADAISQEARKSFSVVLRRSGKRIDVGPNESILQALERSGIQVPFSCREGTCGTCETRVLAGRPEHWDAVLSNIEKESGQTMLVCVSRSQDTILELDL